MNEEKLVGKVVGEKKMEAIVQRLGRLTQDEAWQTVAHILEVVLGLVKNMKVVMGGEQIAMLVSRWVLRMFPCRRRGIGCPSYENTRYVFQATIQCSCSF